MLGLGAMLFLEFALGVVIALVVLMFLAAVLHIVFWVLLFVVAMTAMAIFVFHFPLGILFSLIVALGVAAFIILVFKALVLLGRRARLSLSRRYPPGGPPA